MPKAKIQEATTCAYCGKELLPVVPWQKYHRECARKPEYQRLQASRTVTARAVEYKKSADCTRCKAPKTAANRRTAFWWNDEDREQENFEVVQILCAKCLKKLQRIKAGQDCLMGIWERNAILGEDEQQEWFKEAFGSDGPYDRLSLAYGDEAFGSLYWGERQDLRENTELSEHHGFDYGLISSKAKAPRTSRIFLDPRTGLGIEKMQLALTDDQVQKFYELRLKLRGHIECPRCQEFFCEVHPNGSLVFEDRGFTWEETVKVVAAPCPACSSPKRPHWVPLTEALLYGEKVIEMDDKRREHLNRLADRGCVPAEAAA